MAKGKSLPKGSRQALNDAEAGLKSAFSTTTSILEENGKLYEQAQKRLDAQLEIMQSINGELRESTSLNKDQKKNINDLIKQYGKFQSFTAKIQQDVEDRVISEEQAHKQINQQYSAFKRLLSTTKLTGKENEKLLKLFEAMTNEMGSVGDAMDKTRKKMSLLNTAVDQLGSSGIPLAREFSETIKSIGGNAEVAKGAITALAAAAGVLAAKYFLAGPQAEIEAGNEVKALKINTIESVAKIENKRNFIIAKKELARAQNRIDNENEINRLTNERNFSSQRAAIQFGATMQSNAAEFNAAAKTAYFGNGIGSVGYAAGQMQLAGIGAEQIAQSLSAATKDLGSRPSSNVAADMAVLEKRTGASADNIASMFSFFKRTDKVSSSTALNMVEGMRAMANSANIDLGGMMEEVANATKDAYSYQIKSGDALRRQVTYASSIGVSFNDVAKAGRSMVLNYKDSIKNEMQLSAMLGRNVNLSEARALFAQGRTDEALQSIKGQGLDPTKMNMFQQEALSQALGGLDLNSLQKIATTNGKNVSATTGNVKGGNQGFLTRTQGAQSALASQQAYISAQTAIIDQQLSAKITDAYLNSPGYKQYQANLLTLEKRQAVLSQKEESAFLESLAHITALADRARLGIEKSVTENVISGVAGVASGVAGNYLAGKILPKAASAAATGAETSVLANSAKMLGKNAKLIKGLGVVGAGLDVYSRKQAGQTNTQAIGGAAGGFAGSVAAMAALTPAIASISAFTGPAAPFVAGALELGAGAGGYFLGSKLTDYFTGAGETSGAKPAAKKAIPSAVKVTPGGGGISSQSMTLSDVQYQTRLQTEMVALLGLNTGFMKQLLEISSAEFDRPITLNGTKLNATLLSSARKNYGVARKEAVGAYKAP